MTRHDELLAEYVAKSKSASFRRLNSPTVQLKYAYPLPADHPPLASRLPAHQPQPLKRQTLRRPQEEPSPSATRPSVIITRCSSGHLDRDNLYSSTKAIVDALRYAGYIAGDTEQHIDLHVFQKKVPRKEAGTLIEIVSLPL